MSFTVKQARLMSGKSQQKLAEILGIHVNTYRRIEEHPEKATIEQAHQIAEGTGVPYDNIIFLPMDSTKRGAGEEEEC